MPVFDVPLDRLRRRNSNKWRRFEPDVLPMFVAEMDVDLAPPVRERLEQALRDGDTGYPELPVYQEAFARFAAWRWGWDLDPADAQLATDVVTGMRDALVVASEPGDAIAFNSPIYPPFRTVISTTGRQFLDVPLVDDRLDLASLERAFAERRPKVYLLCSPHNPTGTIHTREELEAVARLAAEYGVTVISNEIHAPLAGATHVPYLDVTGSDGGLIVTSASKSWNLAGMKAALVIGDPKLRSRLSPILAEGASFFGVLAHTAALDDARDWLVQAATEIAANKELLAEQLRQRLPQLSYRPSAGTYLAWLDCSPLNLPDPGRHFHEVGRVRFNPGTDYASYAQQFVRLNLATSPEIVQEGVRRMAACVGGLE